MALNKETVAQLYVALFQRAAAKNELDEWYKWAEDKNADMKELAGAMLYEAVQLAKSDEYTAKFYPEYANLGDTTVTADQAKAIIEKVYSLLLGKDYTTDPKGIDGWVKDVVDNGGTYEALGDTLAGIVYVANQYANGELEAPDDVTKKAVEAFKNKTQVAVEAAETIPTNDPDGDGKPDFDIFQNIVKVVTDDPATVEVAEAKIKDIVANIPGETFYLTYKADAIEGTDAKDTFIAGIVLNDVNGNQVDSFNNTDSIDGKDGIDTLKATVLGSTAGTTYSPVVANVENIIFKAFNQATYDMVNTTGVKYIENNGSIAPVTFNNIQDEANVAVKNIKNKNTIFSFDTTQTFTGLSDEITLTLDNVTAGSLTSNTNYIRITGNDIKTLNIVSTGKASSVALGGTALNGGTKTLNISGDANLTLRDTDGANAINQLTKVDASKFTGNLKATLTNSNTDITVTGGSGDDYVILGNLDKKDSIDLGDGEDTLVVSANDNDTITDKVKMANVEKLAFSLTNGADPGTFTLNTAGADSLKEIDLGVATGNAGDTIKLTNLAASANTVKYNAGGVDVDTNLVSLNYQLASTTGEQTLNIDVTNKDANGNLHNTTKGVQLSINTITADGVENVNIKTDKLSDDSDDTTQDGGMKIATLRDDKLHKLTIDSPTYVEITNALNSTLKEVDASNANGGVKINLTNAYDSTTTAADRAVTVTTGSGKDTVSNMKIASASYTVKTGDGNDSISTTGAAGDGYTIKIDAGAGNDTVDVSSQTGDDDSGDGTISVTLGDGQDKVVLNGAGTANKSNDTTIEDFVVGSGGDKIDLSANNSDLTNKVKYVEADVSGAATLAVTAGMNVLYGANANSLNINDIRDFLEAQTDFETQTKTAYFVVTDGTNSAIVEATDSDGSDATLETVDILAILKGVDNPQDLVADNFADFLA